LGVFKSCERATSAAVLKSAAALLFALTTSAAVCMVSAMTNIHVTFARCGAIESTCPAYQTDGAAGLDLHAALAGNVILGHGERALIPTGWSIEIPAGYEGQVRPRSGLALHHGVTVLNAPGTIDSDYRGELGVVLINFGAQPIAIRHNDRIAQLVIATVTRCSIDSRPVLSLTHRGASGFGSTGGFVYVAPPGESQEHGNDIADC
jgi:dUTP pyrophosphatase